MRKPVRTLLVMLTGFASLALKMDAQVLSWTNKASLPQAAYINGSRSFGVSVLGKKLYLVGGLNWPSPIPTVYEYDPATDAWTQRADMLTNRYAPAAASANGKLYAIGGGGNSGALATVEEYDPLSNTWTNKANMQYARWALQAVTVSGRIYAIGGLGGTGTSPTDAPYIEEYDPGTDTWSTKANLPSPRTSFGATVLNGNIYVIGGYDNNNHAYIPQVWEFNPGSNAWTIKAAMPTPRETLAVVNVNERIWAMGGSSPGLPRSTVEEYDPISNSWTSKASLPSSNRNECFATVFDDLLYVFGGYDVWTMQAAKIAPILNFYTAVELEFLTKTGKVYQLQASPDLVTWTNFGPPIVGDGGYWSNLNSTRGKSKLFFRFADNP